MRESFKISFYRPDDARRKQGAGYFCLSLILLLSCGLIGSPAAHAQATNSADLRGTVTDSTGARLPEVAIEVTNNDTGVTNNFTTDSAGLYDTGSIVVGHYKITFSKDGFAPFQRSSVTLQVGVSTVNASLKVGSASEEVIVTTDLPLLSTESGEQSTTMDSTTMQQLPNVGTDWQNFVAFMPGATGTSNANPQTQASVNGNLPYSNVLSDGASTTLSHSQNSDVNTFETVSELQVSTSAFSAQYGIGGVIFNQISKGGTSQFHGSAYDYLQNTALNASSYQFSVPPVPISPIHYNNFGGSIGGPILKKKLFFYFNYDQTINNSFSTQLNSIPTTSVMGGDFTGTNLPTLYDPTTQVMAHDANGNPYPVRQSFASEYGSNAIPQGLFDTIAAKFQQFYPTPGNHISNGQFVTVTPSSNGVYSNNFRAIVPSASPDRKYFGRLDYDISQTNRLTISVTQGDIPEFFPSAVTSCPIGCSNLDVERYNPQVSDVWTISPTTMNEARLGYTYQGNFWNDDELNHGYAAQLGWTYAKADQIPAIQFYRDYPYAWIEPETNGFYKENVFDPSDVLTLIRGKHVIHVGGEMLIYRENSTAYGDINAGSFQFNGDYTSHWVLDSNGVATLDTSTGADYADFLLGYANSWSASVTPEYGGRLKSPEMFVQDDYKIRENLTLNLGLRYQIQHGWNEINGNEAVFDPTVPNTATGTLGAYWYGSTHANGRNSLQANVWNTVLPRVGFSWLPHPTMTVRGGFGMYVYNWSLDAYGAGMGAAQGSSGSQSDQTNGITPEVKLDSNGANLPYSAFSTDPTRFNNQNATYNQYHTPMPTIYQWNFAVQQQVGSKMVWELAYVASHAKNLSFSVDTNQVPESKLSSNDVNEKPYTQYGSITGSTNNAISNYNSLQASITRRLSQGLSFNFNYVWSHFLDDMDSSGWGSHAGPQTYQNSYSPAASYGNSNFDVRHAFKGNIVYELPFGIGKPLLSSNHLVDEIVGGWQLSSTMLFQTGNPFTLSSTQNTYAQGGGSFPNVVPGMSIKPVNGRSIHEWFNPAAFSLPANGTFGNERRNQLYGPGLEEVNISASKRFTLYNQVKLQIRADATNAFNHASFGQPNVNLQTYSGQQAGDAYNATAASQNGYQITSATIGGRNIQLGAHLEF